VNTSTQASLPSTDTSLLNTILEEKIGVENSPPQVEHNLEVNSADQQQNTYVENLSDNPSNDIEVSPMLATPTMVAQSTGMSISLEELEKLEKINPLESFDLMIKNEVRFSKTN